MIHDEDYQMHKKWRSIYLFLFFLNIFFMPQLGGAIATGILAMIIVFLFWGQHLAIKDIENRRD